MLTSANCMIGVKLCGDRSAYEIVSSHENNFIETLNLVLNCTALLLSLHC